MTEITLGYGIYYAYGYYKAIQDAWDDVKKNLGEELSEIWKWCEENIPNNYEFYEEKECYNDKISDRKLCRIYVELYSIEAEIAFKLRWL